MRLIDADLLMDDINHSLNEMTKIGLAVDGAWLWAKLNDALENAPTIESERKKGKWITDKYGAVVCSKCKWNAPRIMTGCLANRHLDYDKSGYCWHCGADMRGEQDD